MSRNSDARYGHDAWGPAAITRTSCKEGGGAHTMINVGSSDLPLSVRRSINLISRLKRAKLCIGKIDRKDPISIRLGSTAARAMDRAPRFRDRAPRPERAPAPDRAPGPELVPHQVVV
jgi:hypothetical protein